MSTPTNNKTACHMSVLFLGNDRRVSIYEVLNDEDIGSNSRLDYELVASKDNVYGRHNGWETFTITDSVKR